VIYCDASSHDAYGFAGLRVLSLESRRAAENGQAHCDVRRQPMVAPTMREVPLESNVEAQAFTHELLAAASTW